MSQKRVVTATAVLGLALILFWGCQNSKPVGPMKYVTVNASISTKGVVDPKRISSGMELMYRVTGPSMNPVSGKVTIGSLGKGLVNSGSAAVDSVEPAVINFTADIPAGPSRVLAIQLSYIPMALEDAVTNPRDVQSIGAVQFDIDPGTQVVNVPVELGTMCGGSCYEIGACPSLFGGYMAYMGNTDLVNCAYVPNSDAFKYTQPCYAKAYAKGVTIVQSAFTPNPSIPSLPIEAGDVFCVAASSKGDTTGHYWLQFVDNENGYLCVIYRYNNSLPFYAFDPNFYCNSD
jgi:hypothetical protein